MIETTKIQYSNRIEYRDSNYLLHREDGPAVEYFNGDKFWYINGKCHRENGPAREYTDGSKFYFIDGNILTKEEYYKAIDKEYLLSLE